MTFASTRFLRLQITTLSLAMAEFDILDAMFNRTLEVPMLGNLRRRWGYWQGTLVVPCLREPLELRIECPRKAGIDRFVNQAKIFPAEFARLRPQLAAL